MNTGGTVVMRQAISADEFSGRISISLDHNGEGVLMILSDTEPGRFVHVYMSADQVRDLHDEISRQLAKPAKGGDE